MNNAEEPELEVFDEAIALQQKQADEEIARLMAQRVDHFPTSLQASKFELTQVEQVTSARKLKWSRQSDGSWQSSGKPANKDTTTIEFGAKSENNPAANNALPGKSTSPGNGAHQSLVAIRLHALANSVDGRDKPSIGWSSSQNFVITQARLEQEGNATLILNAATATMNNLVILPARPWMVIPDRAGLSVVTRASLVKSLGRCRNAGLAQRSPAAFGTGTESRSRAFAARLSIVVGF